MKAIKKKLNNQQGATLLMALMLLLVVIMVCYVILNASLSSGSLVAQANPYAGRTYDSQSLDFDIGTTVFYYDGKTEWGRPSDLNITVRSDSGTVPLSDCSVKFSTDNGSNWVSAVTRKEKGRTEGILISITYNGLEKIKSYTLTVKQEGGITLLPPQLLSANYSENVRLVGAARLDDGSPEGTVIKYLYNGVSDWTETAPSLDKTATLDEPLHVTAMAECSGYDTETIEYDLVIKTSNRLTVSATGYSGEYDGESHGGTIKVTLDGNTIPLSQLDQYGITISYTEGGASTQSITVKDAGDKKNLRVTVSKKNYKDSYDDYTLEVTKATGKPALDVKGEFSYEYNGEPHKPTFTEIDGTKYTYQYRYNENDQWINYTGTGAPAITDSGTIYIKIIATNSAYTETNEKETKVTVTPCDDEVTVTVTGKTITTDKSGNAFTYTGSDISISSKNYDFFTWESDNALYNKKTDSVKLANDKSVTGKNAGSTAFGLKGTSADNDCSFVNNNSNFSNVRFEVSKDGALSIAKCSIAITLSGTTDPWYDGKAHAAEPTITLPDNCPLTLNDITITAAPSATNIDEYTYTSDDFSFTEKSGNYAINATGSVKLIIKDPFATVREKFTKAFNDFDRGNYVYTYEEKTMYEKRNGKVNNTEANEANMNSNTTFPYKGDSYKYDNNEDSYTDYYGYDETKGYITAVTDANNNNYSLMLQKIEVFKETENTANETDDPEVQTVKTSDAVSNLIPFDIYVAYEANYDKNNQIKTISLSFTYTASDGTTTVEDPNGKLTGQIYLTGGNYSRDDQGKSKTDVLLPGNGEVWKINSRTEAEWYWDYEWKSWKSREKTVYYWEKVSESHSDNYYSYTRTTISHNWWAGSVSTTS